MAVINSSWRVAFAAWARWALSGFKGGFESEMENPPAGEHFRQIPIEKAFNARAGREGLAMDGGGDNGSEIADDWAKWIEDVDGPSEF